MSITNVPGADEKNARLDLKLRADSGYRADSTGHRVSANEWAAILSICEDTATGKVLMAAPDLLKALEWLHSGEGKPVDVPAVIAKAKGIA